MIFLFAVLRAIALAMRLNLLAPACQFCRAGNTPPATASRVLRVVRPTGAVSPYAPTKLYRGHDMRFCIVTGIAKE